MSVEAEREAGAEQRSDPRLGIALDGAFARALPELGVPWRAMRPEHPAILRVNDDLARELGLDAERLRGERGLRLLLGNELPEGSSPVAQVYAGHQFGAYAPRLGDGRALLLGEIADVEGRVRDLHLKGSGRTPFARADGFAAVGPMLREYLMGEAMHALGIPTTRALAVVATGRHVVREEVLPGAVLARVASSHLRVGSFQYARSLGDPRLLRRLADFAIARHFGELAAGERPYLGLLEAVVSSQARLVASWMLVGFVHGVMNTDNTAIAGETIDYGPCAFIDAYDPGAVFSSIDRQGRYAYGNQPAIALWNLTRLAETLLPLLSDDVEAAKDLALGALGGFEAAYERAWTDGMRAKLGLGRGGAGGAAAPGGAAPGLGGGSGRAVDDATVSAVAAGLLGDLQTHRVDYTGAFVALAHAARGRAEAFGELFPEGAEPGSWFASWLGLAPDAEAMDAANPRRIPRNHLVDEALDAANDGDLAPFDRMLEAVTHPYLELPGFERYALPAPVGSRPHVTYCGT